MSSRTINLNNSLYRYLLDHSVGETALMRKLRETTSQQETGRMQISPEQGQFMTLLVELLGAKHILEIGTYTGYSALCMARAMPADGELVCCDISREWTDIARSFWREAGVEKRISLHIAPALDTLERLIGQDKSGSFDMAFIDADKTNYLSYYERCLKLLRNDGLLLFDNTLWGGAVADPGNQDEDTRALRELNDRLHRDERLSISLVPIGDGLTLVRKRAEE